MTFGEHGLELRSRHDDDVNIPKELELADEYWEETSVMEGDEILDLAIPK